MHAPFYSRAIPVHQIATITCGPDDGMNHGLLNWFVTGLATSPDGLRINNGGQARIDMSTTEGLRSVVVVDDQDHWCDLRPDHIERIASTRR